MESLSTVPSTGGEGELELPSSDETPLEALERRETRERVQSAIAALPPNFRLPLVLKDLMDLSIGEVAEILGIKEATVKTRLHRARLYAAKEISRDLPARPDRPRDHARKVCLDLLRAKQEAMDRGVAFPVAKEELCVRCRSLFAALNVSREACREMGHGDLPEPVRNALLEEINSSSRRRPKKGE
jgi:hypothetical protein